MAPKLLVSSHTYANTHTHTSTLKHRSRLPLPKLIRLHLTLSQRMEGWRGKQGTRQAGQKKKKKEKGNSALCPVHLWLMMSGLLVVEHIWCQVSAEALAFWAEMFLRFKSEIRLFNLHIFTPRFKNIFNHQLSVTYKGSFLHLHVWVISHQNRTKVAEFVRTYMHTEAPTGMHKYKCLRSPIYTYWVNTHTLFPVCLLHYCLQNDIVRTDWDREIVAYVV